MKEPSPGTIGCSATPTGDRVKAQGRRSCPLRCGRIESAANRDLCRSERWTRLCRRVGDGWTRVSVPPARLEREAAARVGDGGRDDGGEIGDNLRADVGPSDELIEWGTDGGGDSGVTIGDGDQFGRHQSRFDQSRRPGGRRDPAGSGPCQDSSGIESKCPISPLPGVRIAARLRGMSSRKSSKRSFRQIRDIGRLISIRW
jgi:hypothetical protein